MDAKPSTYDGHPWIWTKRHDFTKDQLGSNTGEWLLYPATKDADECWEKVRQATILGELGILAKVSTALRANKFWKAEIRVICVYTHDCSDTDDVRRVGMAIARLGWQKASYKTTADTRAGKYAVPGRNPISKFALRDGQVVDVSG